MGIGYVESSSKRVVAPCHMTHPHPSESSGTRHVIAIRVISLSYTKQGQQTGRARPGESIVVDRSFHDDRSRNCIIAQDIGNSKGSGIFHTF
jgi:hypothetical protein